MANRLGLAGDPTADHFCADIELFGRFDLNDRLLDVIDMPEIAAEEILDGLLIDRDLALTFSDEADLSDGGFPPSRGHEYAAIFIRH